MKIFFAILGFLFLGLGCVGIYLPILPTTPFLMLSAACFAKSSDRFKHWFCNTKLYRENVLPIVNKQGMSMNRKLKILGTITIVIGISMLCIGNLHARIVLAIVLLAHWVLLIFKVKTVENKHD